MKHVTHVQHIVYLAYVTIMVHVLLSLDVLLGQLKDVYLIIHYLIAILRVSKKKWRGQTLAQYENRAVFLLQEKSAVLEQYIFFLPS